MELIHTLLSFVIILSVIVFIHEFGHYLVARLCGVRIEAFSIGFGKEIFGFNDRHGTRWKFSLVPMGGYVKMFGDASETSTPDGKKLEDMSEEEKRVSFHFKPLSRKAAIVVAGPLANFLLTIAIFTFAIFTNGLDTTDPIVGTIIPGSPAEAAGLHTGDRVLSIDGREVNYFRDIPRMLATNTGTEVTLRIQREGDVLSLPITPAAREETDPLGNKISRPMLGFSSQKLTYHDVGFFPAIGEAVARTWGIVAMTFDYLGQLITGTRNADELSGPIGIAKLSGQATERGMDMILWFIAMLSANLGMINLFPIPPLDGGHLMFYTLQGLRGRPVAEKFQEWGFKLGFFLLIGLMLFVSFNDIKKMFLS